MSLSSSLPPFTSPLSYSRPVYVCFFFHSGALPDLPLPNHASPSLPLLPSLPVSGWVSGSHIWRPCNRYGLSAIGLPCVIHFCNLGDGLMWRLHPCPHYDSVSACGEERLVRGGIDWSFTLHALFAPPLSFFIHLFLTCRAALIVWP